MTKQPTLISWARKGDLSILDLIVSLPEFFREADCSADTADLFFAEDLGSIAKAKQVCASCPILSQCASWALQNEVDGIYGGMTTGEREALQKHRKMVSLEAVREMQEQRSIIMLEPLRVVADKFDIDERTVSRWRNLIKSAELKAS